MRSDNTHRGISRREFLAGAALLSGVASMLGGCGRKRAKTPSGVAEGAIRIALDADIETLDPAMHRSRHVEAVVRNICDGLVTRDHQMRCVPQLATSWKVEGDTRWVFDLREGVEFHNGHDFTAEDVKFTIDRIIGAIPDLPPSPRKDLLGPVVAAEVVNARRIAIITETPYPILDKKLVFQEVCPKRYFEEVGPEEFARHPVGTGPFEFSEWRPGERIMLEKFDRYYGGSPQIPPVGVPELAGVIFRPLEEAATRLASLEAGEVHITAAVPPDQGDHVDALPKAHLATTQGTRTFFVGLNCSRKPFQDKRIREAVRCAVDPTPIIENFLYGRAQALPGILIPMAFGYDSSLPQPKQDIARAKALLKDAGHPNGLDVTFDCDANDKRIAEAIAGTMKPAGVRAEVRVWKKDNLLNQLRRRQRDMFLTSWGNSSLDPSGILPVLFSSTGYSNFFGYKSREVDRLLTQADRSMDESDRADKFRQAQQILHGDIPTAFHFATEELYGVLDTVDGFHARPDGMLPMHDVSLEKA